MPERPEARVGGTIVVEARAILREICGPEAFDASLATLPPGVRDEYLHATSLSWVSVDTLERVVGACAARLGRDALDLNDELSRIATERAFGTVWRIFLRFTTDRALLSRTPVIYAKTYDTGRIVPRFTAPGRAEVDLLDFPGAPPFVLRALRTGIETTLRCAGRDHARVELSETPHGALFTASWVASGLRSA